MAYSRFCDRINDICGYLKESAGEIYRNGKGVSAGVRDEISSVY
ncbi:hypothetical protein CLOL250_01270 [Clostridium sp. L2-50]|nr:hypothetical protein CLOL250_01270 [Clostridium sp. L2-50]